MVGAVLNQKEWLIDLEFFKKRSNGITLKIEEKYGHLIQLSYDEF